MIDPSVLAHYHRVATHEAPIVVPPPAVVAEPIPGVRVMRLDWHADARGALVECHRDSWTTRPPDIDEHAFAVGDLRQVYVSETMPGVVKGWHLHLVQTDRFVALRGRTLLALCDLRGLEYLPDGATPPAVHEVLLDPDRAMLRVEVPPGVAHGWLALGPGPSVVLNCCSHEYDGTDEHRCDPHGPPAPGLPVYDWRRARDG